MLALYPLKGYNYIMDVRVVVISKKAEKQLRKIPSYILEKLLSWVNQIEEYGLMQTRCQSGYHDEPLKGDRMGQRSVCLNHAY